jgi:dipeptidyl aminopeptidase/acylaminoacyl peptidase
MLSGRSATLWFVLIASATGAAQPSSPSIDDLLNLKRVAAPAISPDGRLVAYTVRETNWDENAYETEIWVGDGTRTRQLTHARKSSQQPAWSPDGRWLAFVSDRDGKRQLYRIALEGGEAEKLTSGDEDVTNFAWSPDGARIAFTMTDPIAESVKEREKRFGEIRIEDEDRRMAHLHVLDVTTRQTRKLTKGDFVVGAFDWSPNGARIAFDHRVSSDPSDSVTADISIVDAASGATEVLVGQNGPDSNPRWSPDGLRIAFVSAMAKQFPYYENGVIAVVQPGSATIQTLSAAFDEEPSLVAWKKTGIYFSASQRTWAYLYRIDPTARLSAVASANADLSAVASANADLSAVASAKADEITRHAARDAWIGSGFSINDDATRVAFIAAGPTEFADVYLGPLAPSLAAATRVSNTAAQIASWPKHTREVVRWISQDGTEIEGVLHKPADFQKGRRYPLLVVIHGGPTGVSRPVPYTNSVGYYPIDLWLSRGALVLEPNYRGSAGYGEKFRSLNVRNLGIGDAWDVLSGIDKLAADGLVDPNRVGAMGWSQGGYISAFLTTKHSERFKAVSVGAGISNWMTYYVNTDIHPFTRQYLKATPWDDPRIYADTSPMTYIKNAKAPTLIQHGDQDQRVPPPNAFELYQGLRDQNVPVQLVLFKGFGHPLNKPKANRGAMQQNFDWFNKYVWANTGVTR